MPRNRRKISLLTCGAIAVACVLAAVLDVTMQAPSIQPFFTANPNGITFIEVRIPLRDGNSLAGYAVLPANYESIPTNSACLTIISPGVNGRKEAILWKAYNFALHGFIAIAIEARGHGFSTGICSIGIEEPKDISDAITWALAKYSAVNVSRVSLYGQSLGGMFTVTAACQDPRVTATVALHPPANFSKFLAPYYEVANLLGYLPSINLDEESLRLRSPIEWINATTPHNILFIHGDQDELVPTENSFSLSLRINSTGRSINDSYVIIRPGLTHPGNEADHHTLALGIAWLNWSLTLGMRPLPDTLAEQAGNIVIEETPIGSRDLVANFLLVATAALFVFILLVLRKPQAGKKVPPNHPATGARESRKGGIVLLGAILCAAFFLGVTNVIPFIWAYLLVLPLIALGIYLFLGAFLAKKGVQGTYMAEWRDKARIRNVIVGVGAVVGTAILYALVYSPIAQVVMHYGIFPWSTAPLFYASVIVLNFIIDSLLLKAFHWGGSPQEAWQNRFTVSQKYVMNLCRESFFVLVWRLGSMALCGLFLPEIFILDFPIAINLIIIIILPLLAMLVYFLAGILDLGTKSHAVSLLIVGAIVAMYLQWRLFRLF